MKLVESHGLEFMTRPEVDSDMLVIKEIMDENVYEVTQDRLRAGGVVIDIGANIGVFSLFAARYGVKVIAVEPEPHNLVLLYENIDLNSNTVPGKIVVCEKAVSDFRGDAVIGDSGGASSIVDDGTFGINVEVITLDDLFAEYNVETVAVLKIDVEGSEVPIILGASKETLNKCKYITLEFDKRTGWTMGDIVAKLSETHHVRTMGSWERGGMIWAWLY